MTFSEIGRQYKKQEPQYNDLSDYEVGKAYAEKVLSPEELQDIDPEPSRRPEPRNPTVRKPTERPQEVPPLPFVGRVFPGTYGNHKVNQAAARSSIYQAGHHVEELPTKLKEEAEIDSVQRKYGKLGIELNIDSAQKAHDQGVDALQYNLQNHTEHMGPILAKNQEHMGSVTAANQRLMNDAELDKNREQAEIDLQKEYRSMMIGVEAAIREKLFDYHLVHKLQSLVFRQVDIVESIKSLPPSPRRDGKLKSAELVLSNWEGKLNELSGQGVLPGKDRKRVGHVPEKADRPANRGEDD